MENLYSTGKTRTFLIILLILAGWLGFSFLVSSGSLHPSFLSDWPYFYTAGRIFLEGKPLYDFGEAGLLYYNPPWIAFLLSPFSLLPLRFSAGLFTAISITTLILVCRHYQLSLTSATLLMLSPPAIHVIMMGQVDIFVLGGLLLPVEIWPIVAISKPQTALGLALYPLTLPKKLKATVLVCAIILAMSILLFGLWPLDILSMQLPDKAWWNYWDGIWPWNLIPGLFILILGLYRKNELLLLSASPFLMPYATMGAFTGAWLAIHKTYKDWQLVLFFLVSWGLVIANAVMK